jgi:hypothetical protein
MCVQGTRLWIRATKVYRSAKAIPLRLLSCLYSLTVKSPLLILSVGLKQARTSTHKHAQTRTSTHKHAQTRTVQKMHRCRSALYAGMSSSTLGMPRTVHTTRMVSQQGQQQRQRTVVRDPRRRKPSQPMPSSSSLVVASQPTRENESQQQSPVSSSPLSFINNDYNSSTPQSMSSSLAQYALAGVGVTLGVVMVRMVLGF